MIEVRRPSTDINQPTADVHSHFGTAKAFAGEIVVIRSITANSIKNHPKQKRFPIQQS